MLVRRACSYCGVPLREDTRFCINCGKPIRLTSEEIEKKKTALNAPLEEEENAVHIEDITADTGSFTAPDGLVIGMGNEKQEEPEIQAAEEPEIKKTEKAEKPKVSLPKVRMPKVVIPPVKLPKVSMPKWNLPKPAGKKDGGPEKPGQKNGEKFVIDTTKWKWSQPESMKPVRKVEQKPKEYPDRWYTINTAKWKLTQPSAEKPKPKRGKKKEQKFAFDTTKWKWSQPEDLKAELRLQEEEQRKAALAELEKNKPEEITESVPEEGGQKDIRKIERKTARPNQKKFSFKKTDETNVKADPDSIVYYDEEDEFYSMYRVWKWPAVLLSLLIAATVLTMIFGCTYLFRPDLLDSTLQKISAVTGIEFPTFDVAEIPEPTPEPTEEPEPTAEPEPTPEETPEPTPEENPSLGTVKIITTDMNIRQDGSLSAKVVGVAPSGGTYDYYDKKDNDGYTWYKIGEDQWIADSGHWLQVIPKN